MSEDETLKWTDQRMLFFWQRGLPIALDRITREGLYFRKFFEDITGDREHDFISAQHPHYDNWVQFIRCQYLNRQIADEAFVAMAMTLNLIQLPPEEYRAQGQNLTKYLRGAGEPSLERAMFGYKQQRSFASRWAMERRYKQYFHSMLQFQIENRYAATDELRALITENDLRDYDNIYTYYGRWKRSKEGKHCLDIYRDALRIFGTWENPTSPD